MHVGFQEADHVGGRCLDAVGFRGQRPRRHSDRSILLRVALRIISYSGAGNVDIAALHSERRKQSLFHQRRQILPHGLRSNQAEHSDSEIGIGSICSRRVGGLPVFEIQHQLIVVFDIIRHLQWKPPGRMRA